MLFLGNSYTFYNDLDQRVAELFAAAGEPIAAERVANGGWRFADHLAALDTAGTPSADAMARPHDWVFLQEQSQIPGFPRAGAEYGESLAAAVELDARAAAAGAGTFFLMTWGRRDGDSTNPDRYPDFSTMQAHLEEGYLAYAAAAGEDGTPAYVAPAGRAWARVHDDLVAAGEDPLVVGSAFHALYVEDGSHPSPRGTWLTACVVYASLTGRSPEGLAAPPDIADADYLASVAADVVLGGDDLAYPWSGDDDTGTQGDSGAQDSGEPDDSSVAGDTNDSTAPNESGGADGCGCAAPGAGGSRWAATLLGALAVGVGRRRGDRGVGGPS